MTELIVTILAVGLPVGIGVWRFVTNRSWRALTQGIGLGLIALACYFIGITELAVNGFWSIVDWVQRTVWTPRIQNATIMAGIGLVLFVVGGFMVSGKARATAAAKGAPKPVAGSAPKPVAASGPAPVVNPKSGLDEEDEEIAALLRSRGIE